MIPRSKQVKAKHSNFKADRELGAEKQGPYDVPPLEGYKKSGKQDLGLKSI